MYLLPEGSISAQLLERPRLKRLGMGNIKQCLILYAQRRQWHPTPVLLPGKSHGQGSLVGCSPWGREESDTTEQIHFHFSLSSTGEGNGNPLQCSCLENPRDGGAWWAAIYGVAQSRTWLKWLSSSSSKPVTIHKIESVIIIVIMLHNKQKSRNGWLHRWILQNI